MTEAKLLPRPISICEIVGKHRNFGVVYRVFQPEKTRGTGSFRWKREIHFRSLDLWGNVNGFPLEAGKRNEHFDRWGWSGGSADFGAPTESNLTVRKANYHGICIDSTDTFLKRRAVWGKWNRVYLDRRDGEISEQKERNMWIRFINVDLRQMISFTCGPILQILPCNQTICRRQKRNWMLYFSGREREIGVQYRGMSLRVVCASQKKRITTTLM